MSAIICWTTSSGIRKCKRLHVWRPVWVMPWWPEWRYARDNLPSRVLARVRTAVLFLFGPRPHPWRHIDAAVSRESRNDLALLVAIDVVAETRGADLRANVRASVRDIAGRVPLPAGVEATLGG